MSNILRKQSQLKHSPRWRRSILESLENRHMLDGLSIVVDSDADTVADDGVTTLREAIDLANNTPGPNADIITFSLPANSTIDITTQFDITDSVTITGSEGLTIDASAGDSSTDEGDGIRIFEIDDSNFSEQFDVEMSNLTLTGGDAFFSGGAILNSENLTITNSTIHNNYAAEFGGGIFNSFDGTLTVNNSTIHNNSALSGGGGISNGGIANITNSTINNNMAEGGAGIDSNGTLDIINSTIRNNTAEAEGGGIYNEEGSLSVTNSTINNNMADEGGGIFSEADGGSPTTITNSTISGNTADTTGGGVFNFDEVIIIRNSTITLNEAPGGQGSGVASYGDDFTTTEIFESIIAGNVNSDLNFVEDETNSIFSLGNNLIGTNPQSIPLLGSDLLGVPAQLGPLQDNGGPTLTHAPASSSPAVDAIPLPATIATDQRGIARPQGTGVDIGAVELSGTLVGNLNGDNVVNRADLRILLSHYGTATGALPLEGDLDDDGKVGLSDLLLMKLNYGNTSSAPVPAPQAAAAALSLTVEISAEATTVAIPQVQKSTSEQATDQALLDVDQAPVRRTTHHRSVRQASQRHVINDKAIQIVSNEAATAIKSHVRRTLSLRSSRAKLHSNNISIDDLLAWK